MLTGFRDLDALTGGFAPGDLVLLDGEDDDKSAFALSSALHAAQHGEAAAIFSLATNRSTVIMRLVSMLASVAVEAIRGGGVDKRDWPALFRAPHNPALSRLHVLDIAELGIGTIDEIQDCTRQIFAGHSRNASLLSLIVVDPLRLVRPAALASGQQRHRDLATSVIRLKRLARQLRVSVLLVGDVADVTGQRQRELPDPSGLKVSKVATDCIDKLLVLRRLPDREDGAAELQVVKPRAGPTGRVALAWHADRGMFCSVPQRGASTER